MYFRRLEISGFKSFADRTLVRLESGITAIVGPNGCGKSNILDALRWVLGEQNARELRGLHMLDVIFNGSESRQAMGMAEVSVTFDNSLGRLPVDFAEVQVSRRIYRSGESEYLVNKTPCRLRDITELFMDTGIGTNAYSLIGQGKIDLVLSSKPEDRRFLFEEAAGIIKYKARKRVAMRKLEAAEQNLLRLNDVIAEVQRQMRSLKRQVNAAIRFRELKASLQELEVRSLWTKHVRLTESVRQLRVQFAEAEKAYEQAVSETTQFEARNEELALNRLEVERRLAARREAVQELQAEMDKAERQIALLRQQKEFLKEQQQQALQEHEAFGQRAEETRTRLSGAGEATAALRDEEAACVAEIEACQQEHDAAQERLAAAEAHVEALRVRALEKMSDRARAQTELEKLGAEMRNAETLLQSVEERSETEGSRVENLGTRLEELRAGEAAKLAAADALETRRTAARDELAERTRSLRETQDASQRLREQKSSQDARLNSLRELRDSYEGFATGVRAIMMARQRNLPEVAGVIGPVGDLLATEKTYERSIEAVLGWNVNNIVVEEADAAKAAIGFLKQHRAGRVTFLPLDTIRVGQSDEYAAVQGLPGVIGPAIRFVSYEPHIDKAVQYLLHNTVIVSTIDDAIRIARTQRRYPRLVTLDGEIVSSSGAVTGGQTKTESRGLLGRSAEITELEESLRQLDGELARLARTAEALNGEVQALDASLAAQDAEETTLRRELGELGVAIARCATELDSLNQSAQVLARERERLEAERSRFKQQREDIEARADSMALDDAALQQSQAEARQHALDARQALAQCAGELADLRVRHAGLAQRLEETTRDQTREQEALEEALRSAERRLEQARQFEENEASLELETAAHIERLKNLAEDKDAAQRNVVETQNEQETLLRENDEIIKTLRDLHERARAAQAEVHRLEMALRRDEDHVEYLEERALAEYHIALSSLDAEQVGADEHDEEAREALVAELRDKLDRMGQVNLMAIEEYEELEKRNDFLVTQEEDLRKAREALLGIVARIDKTITQMFLDTFQAVGENFRVFFRRLFNGGQARIYLLDESDPLESGIEVEARPPGKKPQGISLLSGGEQALTAIALLFAIFKAKPSPFCVLDEVDAPLDDANVVRFLDLVLEFTDESQFIIITHNKQTMARANVLYGVTMQEKGVSQLVSVRFDTEPETAPEPEPESAPGAPAGAPA